MSYFEEFVAERITQAGLEVLIKLNISSATSLAKFSASSLLHCGLPKGDLEVLQEYHQLHENRERFSRAELTRVLQLLNRYARQFPRIGASLLAFTVESSVEEVMSCIPQDHSNVFGPKPLKEFPNGDEVLQGFWDSGFHVNPIHVALRHILVSISEDHVVIKQTWKDGVPQLELA